jgi:glycosyltransferase involved in cell wall biosynthesis
VARRLHPFREGRLVTRTLIVCRRYWPAVGGVESLLRDVARGLGERHEVTVLAHRIDDGPSERLTDGLIPPPSFEPFDDGPVRVRPLRISVPRRALLTPLASHVVPVLRRYAYGRARVPAAGLYAQVVAPIIAGEADGAEIVHMWGNDLVAVAAMRAARLRGVPGVVTPFAHANQYGVGPADVTAYRAAARVVALLETEAAVYRRLGVSGDRVVVCGAGSPGVRPGLGSKVRRRHRIDGPLVLFLGARRPYKGYDLLLQAAPLVSAGRSDVTFAFAGPGEPIPALPDVRVVDAGFVDAEERASWLEAADILCLPSEAEIFPISVLEAWSVRTPALTSDLPTLVELMRRSGGGTTVAREPRAFADALLELLADDERLRRLGDAGHAFWKSEATVEAVVGRHERLYSDLTGAEAVRCAA